MFCTKFTSTYKSSDKIHDIAYYIYFPLGTVKGVVQISHGMCEYFNRYDHFARFLAQHGYVVCGNDHLGHGSSVNDNSELGYFAEENGWQCVVNDLYTLTKIMKKNYSDLPYFMLGHSMGSFMARAYCTKYSKNLDGVVFCGTSGEIKGIPILLSVIDGLKKIYGDKHRSRKVNKIAFGAYNNKITDNDSEYAWISRDKEVIRKYGEDEKCTFIFTLNGFENIMKVLWYVSQEKWFQTYNKSLPTLLVTGSGDPVGQYGEGVKQVYNKLIKNSCNASLKIYPDARHELLNEINKQEVYDCVLEFLQEYSGSKDIL